MNLFSEQNNKNIHLQNSENILRESASRNSMSMLKSLVDQSAEAIAVLDHNLCYLTVSSKWLKNYNLKLAEVINHNYSEVLTANLYQDHGIYDNSFEQGKYHQTEQVLIDHNGIVKRFQLNIYPWKNSQDQIIGLIVISNLLGTEQSLEAFFNISLDMLCLFDTNGYFKKVNSAFVQNLGYKSSATIINQPLLNFVHPEDRDLTIVELKKLQRGIASIKFENRFCTQDGSYLRLQWVSAPPQKNLNMIYSIARDVTKSHDLQQQLIWQSKHDHLTGLLNRREFEQQISEVIDSACIYQQNHAFCYLDLDRFKVINDICGHIVGDELLRQLAKLLSKTIRSQDKLFRLGGDEFGILFKNCTIQQAEDLAHQIREAIKSFPFHWRTKKFVLSASFGLVKIDQHSQNFSYLLNAADTACHAAKQQSRNWVRIYDPHDQDLLKERDEKNWISKLYLALAENHFRLYSQKIKPLQDEEGANHYEILLRLSDPEKGLISPMEFIPAAERYDLMPSIDRWVISTFFNSYADHLQATPLAEEAIYTINLSGASINNEQFFEFLKQQFTLYRIAPEKICFEITETMAIANLKKAARLITDLKTLGCSFALDDFGSGMSSLAYLKTLPVDYLKIDGNFVKNIVNDPIDKATVECFKQIGEIMKIQTIAEYVENEDIARQLKEIGINYAQGYGIGKPAPLMFAAPIIVAQI